MTRRARLWSGVALCVAVAACSAAQSIPPDQRVQLEVLALKTACQEWQNAGRSGPPEVATVCAAFEPDDAPRGDADAQFDGGK